MKPVSPGIALALIGVVVGFVGVVSHTLLRHCLQVVQAAIALLLALPRSPLARYAGAPIFLFWLFIMNLI